MADSSKSRSTSGQDSALTAEQFRRVLGHYPTGVTAIAACDERGRAHGLIVGTFTSASLDPPLVAFLADKRSSSFPFIRDAGVFCASVLSTEQSGIIAQLAAKTDDKFRDIAWTPTGTGSPRIDAAVAWIDCDLESVHDVGDHDLVVGKVRELGVEGGAIPMLFFRGDFGGFAPADVVGDHVAGTFAQAARAIRPDMLALADRLRANCVATARSGRDYVVVAAVGAASSDYVKATVGQRFPFVPPVGLVFAAWGGSAELDEWLLRLGPDPAAEQFKQLRDLVARVRQQGYAVGVGLDDDDRAIRQLLSRPTHDEQVLNEVTAQWLKLFGMTYNPENTSGAAHNVKQLAAPIFDANGRVLFQLAVSAPPEPCTWADIDECGRALVATAAAASARLAGSK